MTRLSIRIDFEPSGSALGPGMAQLLTLIAQKGSIRAAAAEMDMSYRKAWLLIQDIQKTFNGEVLTTVSGGAAGGGTRLTQLGDTLVRLYREVERHACDAAQPQLAALSALVQENAPRRRNARKAAKRS